MVNNWLSAQDEFVAHTTSVGLLRSQVRNRFQMQAFNYVGSGNVLGTAFTAADATLTDQNTNRDERSTEFFARDAVKLTERVTAWLGLRHTQLHRESVRTDGSRATAYDQRFNAPSLAASLAVDPHTMLYAAWSRGVESEVAPNRARYTNRGMALPALQSRQVEVGIKGGHPDFNWSVAGFDIERLALVDGCYDVRRLPVIRALALKSGAPPAARSVPRQSVFAQVRDMLAPAALGSLASRALRRRA